MTPLFLLTLAYTVSVCTHKCLGYETPLHMNENPTILCLVRCSLLVTDEVPQCGYLQRRFNVLVSTFLHRSSWARSACGVLTEFIDVPARGRELPLPKTGSCSWVLAGFRKRVLERQFPNASVRTGGEVGGGWRCEINDYSNATRAISVSLLPASPVD